MNQLENFFFKYAEASMGNNAASVAAFYDQNFIAASKTETLSFQNDTEFLKWLNGVFEFNKQAGMKQMLVKNVQASPIGTHFEKATVTWAAIFSPKPDEEIVFDIHYILSHREDQYRIVMCMSEEDQEQLMKDKGVL